METRRLELEVSTAVGRREQALERIGELEQRREQLGRFDRAGRRGLDHQAHVQRHVADDQRGRADHASARLEQLREQGRHPDQWIEAHGADAVRWAEVTREQEIRRELAIRAAQERAVREPPQSTRELLGDRRPEDRERYGQLTRHLERHRHRIEHGINTEVDGGLGPVPADHRQGGARSDYAKAHSALSERVVEHRNERGMDTSGRQFDRGHGREASGHGMEL